MDSLELSPYCAYVLIRKGSKNINIVSKYTVNDKLELKYIGDFGSEDLRNCYYDVTDIRTIYCDFSIGGKEDDSVYSLYSFNSSFVNTDYVFKNEITDRSNIKYTLGNIFRDSIDGREFSFNNRDHVKLLSTVEKITIIDETLKYWSDIYEYFTGLKCLQFFVPRRCKVCYLFKAPEVLISNINDMIDYSEVKDFTLIGNIDDLDYTKFPSCEILRIQTADCSGLHILPPNLHTLVLTDLKSAEEDDEHGTTQFKEETTEYLRRKFPRVKVELDLMGSADVDKSIIWYTGEGKNKRIYDTSGGTSLLFVDAALYQSFNKVTFDCVAGPKSNLYNSSKSDHALEITFSDRRKSARTVR